MREETNILFCLTMETGGTRSFFLLPPGNRFRVHSKIPLSFILLRFHNRGPLAMLRHSTYFANQPSEENAHRWHSTSRCEDCGNGSIISAPSWLFYATVFPVSESSMQNLTLNWATWYQLKALRFFLNNIGHFWKLGKKDKRIYLSEVYGNFRHMSLEVLQRDKQSDTRSPII